MANLKVALQLYTVRDDMAKDFIGTHKAVADIGYQYVELAGFGGYTADSYKRLLDDVGLKVVGTHEGLDRILGDTLNKVIDDYKTLECPNVVVPYLAEDRRKGEDGYRKVAGELNEAGRKLKDAGFAFGYHNHAFEFEQKFSGKPGIEILLENTDPGLVGFELDTYWALYGSADPVEFMGKYPGRFFLLHIKDMDPDDRSFAEIGTGTLPLDAIVENAPAAGASALIVEQDTCKRPPLESVQISFDNLRSMGYV